MSTLHDRLVDLAADAPAAAPDPLLWERARAFHRQRRIGTAVTVATVVLIGLGLLGTMWWQRHPSIQPAAPEAPASLPDRVWEPSGWLPGTGGDAPGRLSLLIGAERRGWTGSAWGVVGVSATTGEYRFLDLPGDAARAWALSPDGRRVAYWVTGPITGEPFTAGGQYVAAGGVAVYDLVTGTVVRHEEETPHGLALRQLWWADSRHLAFEWGREDGASGSYDLGGLQLWDLANPEPRDRITVGTQVVATSGTGALLVEEPDSGVVAVDVGTGRQSPMVRPRSLLANVLALSPDGRSVAFPSGGRNPAPLGVVRVGDSDRAGEVVGRDVVLQVAGWVDDGTVAVVVPAGGVQPNSWLERVDLGTGKHERLVRTGGFQPFPGTVATDLLRVEPADFPAPPEPWDPRMVLAGFSLVVVLAALYLWGRWRRVQL